jgi:hypothetical protein
MKKICKIMDNKDRSCQMCTDGKVIMENKDGSTEEHDCPLCKNQQARAKILTKG